MPHQLLSPPVTQQSSLRTHSPLSSSPSLTRGGGWGVHPQGPPHSLPYEALPQIYLNPSAGEDICPPAPSSSLKALLFWLQERPEPLLHPRTTFRTQGRCGQNHASSRRLAPVPLSPRTWAQCLHVWAQPGTLVGPVYRTQSSQA